MNVPNVPSQKRIYYFDLFRILSAFFIVLIHSTAEYMDQVSPRTVDWMFVNLYAVAGAPSVPLFLMISGALMLDPRKTRPLKSILSKALTTIVLYLVWLFLYSLCPFVFGDKAWSGLSAKTDIFWPVVRGQTIYHLWFLPEIALMYLLSPLLKEVVKSKEVCRYYLCLYAIVGILMPSVLRFHIPGKAVFDALYFRTALPMLTGYMGFFVMGYYLHAYVDAARTAKNRALLSALAVGAVLAPVAIDAVDGWMANSTSTIASSPLFAPVLVAAACIFAMGKWWTPPSNPRALGLLTELSSLTFGIYLIHPLAGKILRALGMNTIVPHSWIKVPVLAVTMYALSAAMVWGLKKTKPLNKLVSL